MAPNLPSPNLVFTDLLKALGFSLEILQSFYLIWSRASELVTMNLQVPESLTCTLLCRGWRTVANYAAGEFTQVLRPHGGQRLQLLAGTHTPCPSRCVAGLLPRRASWPLNTTADGRPRKAGTTLLCLLRVLQTCGGWNAWEIQNSCTAAVPPIPADSRLCFTRNKNRAIFDMSWPTHLTNAAQAEVAGARCGHEDGAAWVAMAAGRGGLTTSKKKIEALRYIWAQRLLHQTIQRCRMRDRTQVQGAAPVQAANPIHGGPEERMEQLETYPSYRCVFLLSVSLGYDGM